MNTSHNNIRIPTIEECNKKVGESWYEKNYPDFVKLLNEKYPTDYSFREKLYLYINNLDERPVCKLCGKTVSFRGTNKGYSQYCGYQCVYASKDVTEKAKQTRLEKYGDPNYNNREKHKVTCLEKYGVENPFASDTCKQKIKQILIDRYGVEYAQQSQHVQEVRRNNSLKKYGVDHHMKVDEIRGKVIKSQQQSNIDSHDFLIGYTEDGDWICKCPHSNCNKCINKTYIIPSDNYYARLQYNIELCTNLHPIQWGRKEGTSLEKFIWDILDEFGIEYQKNNRDILKNRELDIYIPSKNIAIECNGAFWHSSQNNKQIKYHIDKYLRCKEFGIQLITIWEDQIKLKPHIIRSILLAKLNLLNNSIYARKCQIKEIKSDVCAKFLNENHIQGRTNSTIRYGLFFKDELVSVMTFTKKDNGVWDLSRFCNKLNTIVIGGSSKLLKHFIKTNKPSKVISFASNDISNGNLYKTLGFVEDGDITQSYWYIHKKDLKRYHRTNFSKSRLKEMGYDINGKTESEIMSSLPFWKIYDAGHTKYKLDILR